MKRACGFVLCPKFHVPSSIDIAKTRTDCHYRNTFRKVTGLVELWIDDHLALLIDVSALVVQLHHGQPLMEVSCS